MVPIENSVEGGVTATLDAVSVAHNLHIVGEALVPITFVVVSREPMVLSQVRSVATHSHAWAQVRRWAEASVPHAEYIPASSTAAGAQSLLGERPAADAAICSPLVAEQLGLHVIASGIEDVPGAVTRFVLVTKPGPSPEMTGADKTTVMIPCRRTARVRSWRSWSTSPPAGEHLPDRVPPHRQRDGRLLLLHGPGGAHR